LSIGTGVLPGRVTRLRLSRGRGRGAASHRTPPPASPNRS
jgi:hypothetical protein